MNRILGLIVLLPLAALGQHTDIAVSLGVCYNSSLIRSQYADHRGTGNPAGAIRYLHTNKHAWQFGAVLDVLPVRVSVPQGFAVNGTTPPPYHYSIGKPAIALGFATNKVFVFHKNECTAGLYAGIIYLISKEGLTTAGPDSSSYITEDRGPAGVGAAAGLHVGYKRFISRQWAIGLDLDGRYAWINNREDDFGITCFPLLLGLAYRMK